MFSADLGVTPSSANYIEDVFSTYLYTGNGSSQTISNGIDLSTYGGMTWLKSRSNADNHGTYDTARGVGNYLLPNLTTAQGSANGVSAFNTTGFTLGSVFNDSAKTYVSWTFRKQAKFFDVVTYTGNGTAGRTVSHNLGSVPGCIIVKRTDGTTSDWMIYHRSLGATKAMFFDTSTGSTSAGYWNDTEPTSTQFSLGVSSDVNANGGTYVAYLFAHDAGGFGASGSDNVISCGSYTGTGASVTVNLGYEPQWVLVKKTTGSTAGAGWRMYDNMRGMPVGGNDALLSANLADAEVLSVNDIEPTATGFIANSNISSTETYIYIAIRRGPMKTPTSGTSVFGLNARTGTGANATVTGGQTDDAVLIKNRGSAVIGIFSSRLTGTGYLIPSATTAESTAGATILQANPWDVMDGVKVGTASTSTNASANTFINYLFRRAPGFFDVVCYTGTGATGQTISHNLTVAPEFIITKNRTGTANNWYCYQASLASPLDKSPALNTNSSVGTNSDAWRNITSTSFQIGSGLAGFANENSSTYVAYLFATCPGVSKVGSYTGTGTTKQIDCGFTGGARFVLIKRTDSTGDWYVWDSARGIVAGNDPYLLLNSTAAEVTGTDYVDTYSLGFEISSTAPAAINANGGSFIFLAIA